MQLEDSIEKPSKENIIWKIRNKKLNLWSGGGMPKIIGKKISDSGKWNKNGKIWKQRGALTNHIKQHTYQAVPSTLRNGKDDNELLPYVYDWEIVQFSIFEGNPLSAMDWWSEYLIKSKS